MAGKGLGVLGIGEVGKAEAAPWIGGIALASDFDAPVGFGGSAKKAICTGSGRTAAVDAHCKGDLSGHGINKPYT